jgi:hypothetical protein
LENVGKVVETEERVSPPTFLIIDCEVMLFHDTPKKGIRSPLWVPAEVCVAAVDKQFHKVSEYHFTQVQDGCVEVAPRFWKHGKPQAMTCSRQINGFWFQISDAPNLSKTPHFIWYYLAKQFMIWLESITPYPSNIQIFAKDRNLEQRLFQQLACLSEIFSFWGSVPDRPPPLDLEVISKFYSRMRPVAELYSLTKLEEEGFNKLYREGMEDSSKWPDLHEKRCKFHSKIWQEKFDKKMIPVPGQKSTFYPHCARVDVYFGFMVAKEHKDSSHRVFKD